MLKVMAMSMESVSFRKQPEHARVGSTGVCPESDVQIRLRSKSGGLIYGPRFQVISITFFGSS